MKLKNIPYYLAIIVFMTTELYAQNTNPVVENVAFGISGTTVTVTYDVSDAEQTTVTISMQVSSDAGSTWSYNFGTATGAIGTGVTIGTGKTITWAYNGAPNSFFKIRIYANDETADGSPCAIATVLYEGKTYNTVQIGTQCWLKENLDVGTRIAGISSQTNNATIEKYCYDDLDANCTTYGGLYQWDEAMQYSTTPGAQGICPTGWHIPTYAEWQTLETTVSSNGNQLKALGQGTGEGVGTNASGFSALLAGNLGQNGYFYNLGGYAFFWSSTEDYAMNANIMYLNDNDSYINFNYYSKRNGFSVRCLKD